jgi:hypothetical protein
MKMAAQDGNAAIELNCFRVSVTIHADWICGKVRGKISWVGQFKSAGSALSVYHFAFQFGTSEREQCQNGLHAAAIELCDAACEQAIAKCLFIGRTRTQAF